LAAAHDEEFFYILNQADLSIPDGFGLVCAGLVKGKLITRFPGADLVYDLCKIAEEEEKAIFLLGGTDQAATLAAQKLKQIYPKLKIVGAEEGLTAGQWKLEQGQWLSGETENKKLLQRINQAKPDIILVAFGHPRQEKWIYHNLKKLPSVKIAIGIGGTFDFMAKLIKRAPKIMRILGIEWLWRLIMQPSRGIRIFEAVIIFPLKFIQWQFIMPFLYRSNVACLLYKKQASRTLSGFNSRETRSTGALAITARRN
jgi:N-acetylglucosaminyldiphosphoundecaprenol N-acetyl-beta-D-mannosaminyltransferase